jgi:hypothetical protein
MSKRSDVESSRYHSYFLRLWKDQEGKDELWRFSLEDPETGVRKGFNQIGELVDFLLTAICGLEK